MATIKKILNAHPRKSHVDADSFAKCAEELANCSQACTACADACLAEDSVGPLVRCIRTNLDCADVCNAAGRLVARLTEYDWNLLESQLRACVAACRICSAECDKHASKHDHCKVCAAVCRDCAEVCDELVSEVPSRK